MILFFHHLVFESEIAWGHSLLACQSCHFFVTSKKYDMRFCYRIFLNPFEFDSQESTILNFEEFNVAVVLTNQVMADPGAGCAFMPSFPKPVGLCLSWTRVGLSLVKHMEKGWKRQLLHHLHDVSWFPVSTTARWQYFGTLLHHSDHVAKGPWRATHCQDPRFALPSWEREHLWDLCWGRQEWWWLRVRKGHEMVPKASEGYVHGVSA